jgi:hypothetical protein
MSCSIKNNKLAVKPVYISCTVPDGNAGKVFEAVCIRFKTTRYAGGGLNSWDVWEWLTPTGFRAEISERSYNGYGPICSALVGRRDGKDLFMTAFKTVIGPTGVEEEVPVGGIQPAFNMPLSTLRDGPAWLLERMSQEHFRSWKKWDHESQTFIKVGWMDVRDAVSGFFVEEGGKRTWFETEEEAQSSSEYVHHIHIPGKW